MYNDLQSTVQVAFLAVKSFQSHDSDLSMFLFQFGSDDLEMFFAVLRTITHSKNCDFLELMDRVKTAPQIENVYMKNPHLKPNSRLSDYIDEPIRLIKHQIISIVEVDGKRVHIANLVICELNNQTKISTDRIFRVNNKNNDSIWVNKDVDDDGENQIKIYKDN